jgi:hypothetical protein
MLRREVHANVTRNHQYRSFEELMAKVSACLREHDWRARRNPASQGGRRLAA